MHEAVDRETLLDRIDRLTVWKRGGQRAPHKPLLLLLALGRQARGLGEATPYEEIAPELEGLLREFGPSRSSLHPEYPFWRLQNDDLWVVECDRPMAPRRSNTDPPKSELVAAGATGSLPPDLLSALGDSPDLLRDAATRILDGHFPSSIHDDILSAVGLDLVGAASRKRPRDPRFRERVLVAYERRCAVCGFDIRLDDVSIGLEAAHIRWHQAKGPDVESNGLALCTVHHKTFDLGAFTIEPSETILVSEHATGSTAFDHVLLRHHGTPIRRPQREESRPAAEHLAWHRREVFRERPRPT